MYYELFRQAVDYHIFIILEVHPLSLEKDHHLTA
jgi:hypothetical protein